MSWQRWDRRNGNPLGHRDQYENPNIAICGGEGGEEEGRVQLQLWLQLLQL